MSTTDPKSMAKRLRADLAAYGTDVTHAQALETIAHLHGHKDWNTMAALERPASDAVEPRHAAIPIFRMFDIERTLAFYVDFLGFRVVWEHRYADHAPLYLEVERDGVRLHLSEHHGDATPGSGVLIEIEDAAALQRDLIARDYPYARPGLEQQDWGQTVTVGDPAGNRIVFLQRRGEQIDRPEAAEAPIVHEIVVPTDPDAAYQTFVSHWGRWWDPQLTPDPATFRDVRVGAVGAPVELIHEDATFPIGHVTRAEPGRCHAQTFTLAVDPDHPTTLTVDFEAADGGTRVTLSHGGWTAANVAERAKFTEWPELLRRYAGEVATAR